MVGSIALFALFDRDDANGSGGDPTATAPVVVPTDTVAVVATATTEPTASPTEEPTFTATSEPPTATATLTPTLEPTATATVTPTVTPTATATLTPTVEPTATVAPTATQQSSIPPNTPFPAGALPPSITQGPAAAFDADAYLGAWRTEDGDAFGRPASFIFGPGTGFQFTTVLFEVDEQPENYVVIALTGIDDDLDSRPDLRLTLNGVIVWEGESPFEDEQWTEIGWVVSDLDWLEVGENIMTIEILSDDDDNDVSEPPWVGFSESVVYYG
jgi:hypothetical protein